MAEASQYSVPELQAVVVPEPLILSRLQYPVPELQAVVVPAAPVILTCCLQYLVPELQAVVVVLQRLARHTSCDPLALQPFNPSTTVELKSQLWFLTV